MVVGRCVTVPLRYWISNCIISTPITKKGFPHIYCINTHSEVRSKHSTDHQRIPIRSSIFYKLLNNLSVSLILQNSEQNRGRNEADS